jgi:hypothetical protein
MGDELLRDQIQHILNAHSAENGSNTPDYILAEYLTDCLNAFDKAVTRRSNWYDELVEPEGMFEE